MVLMSVLYKFKMIDAIKNVLPMMISSVAMAAFGYAMQMISVDVWWQLVSILLCVIVYFGVLLCFGKTRAELLEFLETRKQI